MTEAQQIKGYIPFPCHRKQKKLVFYGSKGRVSDKCPQCQNYALFDLDEMKSYPFKSIRGATSKQNN